MTKSGLSVVLVNWNTRERLLTILDALESAMLTRELQIVVVDNASSDGSAEAVREEHPDVEVRAQKSNLGFGAGANRGVAAACHDLVLLLNTDVEFEADAIERLLEYADRHPYAAVIGPKIVDENGVVQTSHWRVPTLGQMVSEGLMLHRVQRPDVLTSAQGVDCVSGCVFLVRRDAFVRLGGFDEDFFMYFEETDLCRRVLENGHAVHYAPVATFVHEGGGSGHRIRGPLFCEFRRSEILFHGKRGGLLAEIAARAISIGAVGLRLFGYTAVMCTPGYAGIRARAKVALFARGLVSLIAPRLVPRVGSPGATTTTAQPQPDARADRQDEAA